jgi:hypothetical protein
MSASLHSLRLIHLMDSANPPASRRKWFFLAVIGVLLLAVVAVALKFGFDSTRPVSIQPLSKIPPNGIFPRKRSSQTCPSTLWNTN